jgi:N-formylglutamate amidohydrolase
VSASPLVLHIPHSSTVIPAAERGHILLDDSALAQEILYMTDLHTEALYDAPGAARVAFPVSRLIVDPERFADDAQERMAVRGMGVIYTRTSHLTALRQPPPATERRRLLETYYKPHHARLAAAVRAARELFGFCMIIDGHSFSSKALPYEGAGAERPQLCIGTDDFHTPPALADWIVERFFLQGYEVRVNTPFSGALVPQEFYRTDRRVISVMFEVRRDLYMNEETGEKIADFDRLAAAIGAVLTDLTGVCAC